MKVTLITPPASEPVTLLEAKLHLRVDTDMEDGLISALIITAREQVEHVTGQRLVTQTWTLEADRACEGSLYGLTPAQTIMSDGATFSVDGLLPPTLTVDGAGVFTLVCGFGSAAAVPASIKQWMLLRIAALYAQRENLAVGTTVTSIPRGFGDALLDAYALPRC